MTKLIYSIGDILDSYVEAMPEHSDKFMMVSVILGIIDDEMHEDHPSFDNLVSNIKRFSDGT